jgi:hypothetical protein
MSEFIGGPKDGALVPEPLWALTVIEMEQKLYTGGTIVYYYELDEDSQNWLYRGQEGA